MWNVSTLQNHKSKMDKRSFYNHDSSMMTIINMHFENQMHVQSSSTPSHVQTYVHKPKHVGTKELKMKSLSGCNKMDSILLFYIFLNEEHNTSMLTQEIAFTCKLASTKLTNCCHFSNFNKSEMLRLKCTSIQKKFKPYLCKKAIHFLPNQLNGESFC
jgi:hypothetical protein